MVILFRSSGSINFTLVLLSNTLARYRVALQILQEVMWYDQATIFCAQQFHTWRVQYVGFLSAKRLHVARASCKCKFQ